MERNANDRIGNQGTSTGAGQDKNFARDTENDGGVADRARGIANAAADRIGSAGSAVRDRAGSIKDTLADALESGAERLRTQGASGGQVAGGDATGRSAALVSDDSPLAQTQNQIAGGLQGSADWLRDFDLDGMKSGIEHQVKEHPGRTLAIAVGLGYLLGKALRK